MKIIMIIEDINKILISFKVNKSMINKIIKIITKILIMIWIKNK